MIPWVILRWIMTAIIFLLVMGLLYLPIAIIRREKSIVCDKCHHYWIAAFILASLSIGFGYYIQILLMFLFYKGAWHSKQGMLKFYRYLTIIALITSTLGGCSLIMNEIPSNICDICSWSSATTITILVIFVFNFTVVVGRLCWIWRKKSMSGIEERIPLKRKSKSKHKVVNCET
eukprot:215393_1